MKLTFYENEEAFGADALEVLLENEVQNNLKISFIKNEQNFDASDWLMMTVKDMNGGVVLTAARTPPHNIVIYETRNKPNSAALKLLSNELKNRNIALPGVLAEQGTARRFAELYAAENEKVFNLKMTMNLMRLDKVSDIKKAPGFCRELREDDLAYMPDWIKAFCDECNVPGVSVGHIESRIGKSEHYIWEDINPVSCAVNTRKTENGAGVSFVYTPPNYRGKGYASSVVTELSEMLLARGNKFCFLYADAANPVSCGIYRRIGYYDLCVFDEIIFGGYKV